MERGGGGGVIVYNLKYLQGMQTYLEQAHA